MVETVVLAAAFASTGLISLAPNLLLFLFPQVSVASSSSSLDWLSIGQALAAGGLLGDVFLHVIPHAAVSMMAAPENGGHGSPSVGLWILLGFSIFLMTDMIVRSTTTSGHGHHHHHHHGHDEGHHDGTNDKNNSNKITPNNGDNIINHHSIPHHHNTSTVLLNLAADALHNFTDGLAIGASFAHAHISSSTLLGKSTTLVPSSFWTEFWMLLKSRGGLATLSILFHEIPHELGDYATLLKEGFTQRSAILAQFGTAVAALIGTGVGLIAHDYAGDRLVFVTAGGFVYLATVTILPDVLDETSSRHSSWKFRASILFAFGIGMAFLYAVSLFEEMDESGHGHSHSHHSHGHHVDENELHHHDDQHDDHHDHSHHDHHDHRHHDHDASEF
jgi:solute carrier family 39 (zinc transporter), member 7